jgi:hypothetical protein
MLNITIGADPEFFLRDKKTKKFTSAHDIVPGTKSKPHPMKRGGFIQADGTAVEFNIPPAKTGEQFAKYIGEALEDIKEFVDTKKFDFVFNPSVTFDKEYFDSLPENTKALGCDPDFNAYTVAQNDLYAPPPATRTGSGHLHIGFSEGEDVKNPDYLSSCAHLVKHLDATLAVYELDWCEDKIRCETYGAAGNFRPKSYGLEYRTLGNAWLRHPKMWESLFKRTHDTVSNLYRLQDKGCILYPTIINSLNKRVNRYKYYQSLVTNYNNDLTVLNIK